MEKVKVIVKIRGHLEGDNLICKEIKIGANDEAMNNMDCCLDIELLDEKKEKRTK